MVLKAFLNQGILFPLVDRRRLCFEGQATPHSSLDPGPSLQIGDINMLHLAPLNLYSGHTRTELQQSSQKVLLLAP